MSKSHLTNLSDKNVAPIRIVIADDNEVVRNSLKIFLNAYPEFYLVGEASNGLEAIALCAQQDPDLLLMDIDMPVLNGIEATRIIRRRDQELYILAITSFSDNGRVQKILDEGANASISKRSSIDELAKSIQAGVKKDGFNPTFKLYSFGDGGENE